MTNKIISLCFIEQTLKKDIIHSYSIPHLVIHFANWVITALRVIIFELNFAGCVSAVLSYHKNIEEKKFNTAQKKNFFSRELTFANWMFQDFSWGPTFEILAKNPKITKISSFKVLNWSGPHWSKITENRVSNNWACRRNSDF